MMTRGGTGESTDLEDQIPQMLMGPIIELIRPDWVGGNEKTPYL